MVDAQVVGDPQNAREEKVQKYNVLGLIDAIKATQMRLKSLQLQ